MKPMTHDRSAMMAPAANPLAQLALRASGIVRAIAHPTATQLLLRLALATPFWRSGVNKWESFGKLSDVAVLLFSEEFTLKLPGGPYPFPAPATMALLSGIAEVTMPVLLVLGLGTRFAALALLGMTAIIQLTVPDGWPVHITWAAMALALMAYGPGHLSLDHLLGRFAGLSKS